MINAFNKLYSFGFNENYLLNKFGINRITRFGMRFVANLIIPIILKFKKGGYGLNQIDNRELKVIVALTSFPRRISSVWIVLEILLRQSFKPDKIILYLSKDQFPTGMKDLPKRILQQCGRGVDVVFVSDDFRSHKKYYYAMREYPNDIVVTVDDDIFYPTTLLQTLIEYHKKFPNSVICRYAKKIVRDPISGLILSSKDWPKILKTNLKSADVFVGTGGGTLFPVPSNILYKDVSNINLALKLCPSEDDLWINTMLRLNATPIIVVKDFKSILPIIIKNDIKLYSFNSVECNGTDMQLKAVIEYYAKQHLFPF